MEYFVTKLSDYSSDFLVNAFPARNFKEFQDQFLLKCSYVHLFGY
jgi:hypothetical protein